MFFLAHRVICALIITLCTLPSDSLWPCVTFIITMHNHNDFFTLIMCICHSQRALIMTLCAHGTLHGLTVTLVDLPNDIFYPHRDWSAPIITVTLTVFLWDFHSESVRHTGIFVHPQWLCVTITVTLIDFHSMILCESQSNWFCVALTMTLCDLHALTMILHDLTMILCIPHSDSCDTVNYATFKWLCDTDNDLFWSSEWFYVSLQWISVTLQWLLIQSKWLLCDFDKYGCMYNKSVWISHWLVTFTDSWTPLAWHCVPSQLLCMTLQSCV